MDCVKSGDQGLGAVIKRCEWVEGMEIRDRISELGQDLTTINSTNDTSSFVSWTITAD